MEVKLEGVKMGNGNAQEIVQTEEDGFYRIQYHFWDPNDNLSSAVLKCGDQTHTVTDLSTGHTYTHNFNLGLIIVLPDKPWQVIK